MTDEDVAEEFEDVSVGYPWHLFRPMLFPYEVTGDSILLNGSGTGSSGNGSASSVGSGSRNGGDQEACSVEGEEANTNRKTNALADISLRVPTCTNMATSENSTKILRDPEVVRSSTVATKPPQSKLAKMVKKQMHTHKKQARYQRCDACGIAKTHRMLLNGKLRFPLTNTHSYFGTCISCHPLEVPRPVLQKSNQAIYGQTSPPTHQELMPIATRLGVPLDTLQEWHQTVDGTSNRTKRTKTKTPALAPDELVAIATKTPTPAMFRDQSRTAVMTEDVSVANRNSVLSELISTTSVHATAEAHSVRNDAPVSRKSIYSEVLSSTSAARNLHQTAPAGPKDRKSRWIPRFMHSMKNKN
ncbi:expressed unknown protein [Seminavis robusta]|uniref:Uncharacterized protein n=1 Tax=Seminavis robusta TaxID=568900 RepID=A0A9N8ER81_9STRA|nr:expressed unknown protein [Seminavis robusta]|eukprot:Sro1719_g293380.1 n/a (358) ;mRNA; r:587-1660